MEPWEQIASESAAIAVAVTDAARAERVACAALVRAEIAAGEARGIPQTAAAMLLLYRLLGAIEGRS